MLANQHNVSVIQLFLQSFRDSEKKLYGFSHQIQQFNVRVDFSMALNLPVLQVFNGQKQSEYLVWCWEIVSGQANCSHFSSRKTLLNVCVAHFMKLIKTHCNKSLKSGLELIMYTFCLMAKCTTLTDIEEILFDLCIVLETEYQSNAFTISISRL